MKAIIAREPGGPEVLEWVDVPDPKPRAGEVVIEVAATAVNRADLLQRQGLYPPPADSSNIIGLECSGRISAVGAGLDLSRIGENVTALLSGGGYARKVAVPAGQCMSVPAGLSLEEAAALPEVACTVWSNLVLEAGLREGELILIHGGGGGIGTFAIQFARAIGARVAVTASGPKLAECERLGAEILIDYTSADFVEQILEATGASDGNGGANVILDNMGAKYLNRNVQALARNGRLVIIGMQGGTKTEFDINPLLRKNGRIIATSLRGRPAQEKAQICAKVDELVWPLVQAGQIKPVIGATMPLEQAAEAHRMLEAGSVTGKILLTA